MRVQILPHGVSKGRGQELRERAGLCCRSERIFGARGSLGEKVGVPAGLALLSGIFSHSSHFTKALYKSKCHSCSRVLAVPSPSWFPSVCSFFFLLLLNMSWLLCLLTIRALPLLQEEGTGTGPPPIPPMTPARQ